MSKVLCGIMAALFAPFLMVLGFIIWDDHWTGSAFSLNMFKCNITAIWFLLMILVIHRTPASSSLSSSSSDNVEDPTTATTVITDIAKLSILQKLQHPFVNEDVKYLLVSSTIGILIGDWTWIEGLRYIGARKVIVMDSLKPFLAAIAGYVFCNETFLNPRMASLGLLCTVIGVIMVGLELNPENGPQEYHPNEPQRERNKRVDEYADDSSSSSSVVGVETHNQFIQNSTSIGSTTATETTTNITHDRPKQPRNTNNNNNASPSYYYGLGMALLNVVLHTVGATLTKKYATDLSTWEINFIRFGFAGGCMLLITVVLQIRDWSKRMTMTTTTNSHTKKLLSCLKTKTNTSFQSQERASLYQQQQHYESLPTRNTTKSMPSSPSSVSPIHPETPTSCWYALPHLSGSSWIRILMGVVFVSFLNPALTNYAMFQIPLALLLTLESIGPLYSLPIFWILHKKKEGPSCRSTIGAILAVTGIILLSLQ